LEVAMWVVVVRAVAVGAMAGVATMVLLVVVAGKVARVGGFCKTRIRQVEGIRDIVAGHRRLRQRVLGAGARRVAAR